MSRLFSHEDVLTVVDILEARLVEADDLAAVAFGRSKWSATDYWVCMAYWTLRILKQVKRELGLVRDPVPTPFLDKLAGFKAEVRAAIEKENP